MKKLALIFGLLMLLLCLTACGGGEKRVVNVYNWGEYISDGSEDSLDVNAAFEEYYFETYGERIDVVYTTFASNEDMYAKLKSGAAGYDVIIPSDYMIQRLISEDMLEKLDFSNIPNYDVSIADDFRNLFYDPQNEYSVPYTYGMVGVIYNTKDVDEADASESWDLMWNEKYSGKILQFNNSRDAFGTAMYKLGIDVNTDDYAEWQRALDELKAQQPVIQSYVMDEIFNKMESREAAISAYYAGDYLTMLESYEELWEDGSTLEFYYPKDENGDFATNLFVDAYCIPKGAKNKLDAERYINYMLSEEPAIANAEYIYYASPNRLVYENEEYIEYMEDDYDLLYPEGFDFKGSYNELSYHNLPPEMLVHVNELWEEFKINSSTGVLVYTLASVIVIALLAYGVFHTVRKKKRERYY